jgi:hypothetical protein
MEFDNPTNYEIPTTLEFDNPTNHEIPTTLEFDNPVIPPTTTMDVEIHTNPVIPPTINMKLCTVCQGNKKRKYKKVVFDKEILANKLNELEKICNPTKKNNHTAEDITNAIYIRSFFRYLLQGTLLYFIIL